MPIYEFECIECRKKFEEIVSLNKEAKVTCPFCGSKKIRKCISCFGIGGVDRSVSSSGSCSSCSSGTCKTFT